MMRGQGRRAHVFASLFIGAFFFSFGLQGLGASDPELVDAVLVLALDVSASIAGEQSPESLAAGKPHVNELEIQRRGAAQAFRSREVLERLLACNPQGVGFTIVEWSGMRQETQVSQVYPWRTLRSAEDLEGVAHFLENRVDRSFEQSTDLASALRESARLLTQSPYTSPRQIISVSADGDQALILGSDTSKASELNEHLLEARLEVLEQGFTINAIAITTSLPSSRMNPDIPLDVYFDQYVVGGPGSFVLPAESFQDYGRALEETLVRELTNCSM